MMPPAGHSLASLDGLVMLPGPAIIHPTTPSGIGRSR
jgi:hypothetical protein